jgi:Mn2+/Fe2+ NRAMP family transporter
MASLPQPHELPAGRTRAESERRSRAIGLRLPSLLLVLGPGVMVMLADTDAGSIITAGQSGARWGYRLLLLQLLLVPILYLVMELTVRLGIATGKGHAELIRDQFGARWAYLSVGTLLVSAIGALVTEFAGVAGIGRLFGLPAPATVIPAAAALVLLVATGSYRRVEIVGITLGLFELAFIGAAIAARPDPHAIATGLAATHAYGNSGYLALVAANVGAVVMPWMVFYQQGAVVEKKLTPRDLRGARLDTALGAVVTQLVMGAVLVATAAVLHGTHGRPLNSVADLAATLTPALGRQAARYVLALAIGGAALVASIVVALALAWAVAETLDRPRSLDDSPRRAPLFYGLFTAAVVAGAALVLTSSSLVRLSIEVEILNALLLPLVLGFLALLAFRVLPHPYQPGRRHRAALAALIAAVTAIGLLWVGLALGL